MLKVSTTFIIISEIKPINQTDLIISCHPYIFGIDL